MTKPELKTLTDTTMKYLQALEDKQNAEFDKKILADRVLRMERCYENLASLDISTQQLSMQGFLLNFYAMNLRI